MSKQSYSSFKIFTIMKDSLSTKRVHNLIIVDESGSMSIIRKQAFTAHPSTMPSARASRRSWLRRTMVTTYS